MAFLPQKHPLHCSKHSYMIRILDVQKFMNNCFASKSGWLAEEFKVKRQVSLARTTRPLRLHLPDRNGPQLHADSFGPVSYLAPENFIGDAHLQRLGRGPSFGTHAFSPARLAILIILSTRAFSPSISGVALTCGFAFIRLWSRAP